jgi:hypothetical protein
MPYDRRHVVIQWGGTLPGGEIWSNMLRGGSAGTGASAPVPTHDEMISWLQGELKDEIAAWHSRPSTQTSSSVKLTFAKANVVDQDGHYVEQTTNEYVYPTPIAGGSAAAFHPTQVAWCLSLTTGLSRGLAHRGRFYLPCPAVDVDRSNGLVSAADAQLVANSLKTFIEAVADTPGLDAINPFKVLVMSKGGTGGATHVVTGVEVGRVLDTQVRRRNALHENYVIADVDQGID